MGKRKTKTEKKQQAKAARKLSHVFAKLGVSSESTRQQDVMEIATTTTKKKKQQKKALSSSLSKRLRDRQGAKKALQAIAAAAAASGQTEAATAAAAGAAKQAISWARVDSTQNKNKTGSDDHDFAAEQQALYARVMAATGGKNKKKKPARKPQQQQQQQASLQSQPLLNLEPPRFGLSKTTDQLIAETTLQVQHLGGVGGGGGGVQPSMMMNSQFHGNTMLSTTPAVSNTNSQDEVTSTGAVAGWNSDDKSQLSDTNPWSILRDDEEDLKSHENQNNPVQKPVFEFTPPSFSVQGAEAFHVDPDL